MISIANWGSGNCGRYAALYADRNFALGAISVDVKFTLWREFECEDDRDWRTKPESIESQSRHGCMVSPCKQPGSTALASAIERLVTEI